MTLESSKTLGGIGAILLFIGVIPFIQYLWVLGLVGAVLILVALNDISNYYKARGIFRNALYGIIIGIAGIITAVVVAVASILVNLSNIKDFISNIYPGWNGDWSTLSGLTPNTSNLNPSDILPFVTGIFLVFVAILVVIWIFAIISTLFVRRSLKEVADKSNVGSFGTAGLLLLIGAIIPLLGLILMWIATLILAVAFFSMKPQEQQNPTMTSSPPPPTV